MFLDVSATFCNSVRAFLLFFALFAIFCYVRPPLCTRSAVMAFLLRDTSTSINTESG